MKVVIIGAGLGGLSAAIHLASAGVQVTVLEQNATIGGKMNSLAADGFTWDTGPSVITMRHVFEALFAHAGRHLADYVQLQPVEPLTRYFYPDGARLDASPDLRQMIAQIAQIDARDIEGYLQFLAYAARVHRITGPVFIYNEPPTLASCWRVPPTDFLKAGVLQTLQRRIQRYVRSPHLQQLLGRYATYVGASPYAAPATLSVIAHVELAGGVWYPRDGVYALAQGMARLAQELGVQIETDCPVQQIVTRHERVCAVVTQDGRRVEADAVVANVDVTTVYDTLLPHTASVVRRLVKLKKQQVSGSGFVLMLGVEKVHADLLHHNILFSRDYRCEFDDIFQRGIPPRDPTIYINITSKTDRQHAPPGCENWFVLVNAPPIGDRFDWHTQAAYYGDRVLETIARFGFDVRGHIRSRHMLTPLDIARQSGAWRGALYGLSAHGRFSALRRPHNRCSDVAGLYFAGGATHPGGGTPLVTLSGQVAANMILRDMGGSIQRLP
ncbi:MAG: phytoene desaturase [Caldilineaceae bacterium]|nr:phytoene desaturase [Caldilineaceae bacterium]